MNPTTINHALIYSAAAAGVIAAGLWYKASVVEFVYGLNRDKPGPRVEFYNGAHRWDPIRTAELQSLWNRRAALAASIAAIFQAVALLFPG